MRFFSDKISIFTAKISDRPDFWSLPFFSQISRIFTMLNVVYNPFLTRKTPFLKLCSNFREHPTTLLLKILGGGCMGRSPTSNFLGDRPLQSPPRSPPLMSAVVVSIKI